MNAQELAERVADKWNTEVGGGMEGLVRTIAEGLRAAGWDRFEAMEAALREIDILRSALRPAPNEDQLEARLVFEILDKALACLQERAPPPLPHECNPDGSPPPAPPT